MTEQNPEKDPAVETSTEVGTEDETATVPSAAAVPEAPTPEPEAVVADEPEATAPEPVVEPEVAGTAEPEATAPEPVVEPEVAVTAEPEATAPEPVVEPEVTVTAEPEATTPEPVVEPEVAVTAESQAPDSEPVVVDESSATTSVPDVVAAAPEPEAAAPVTEAPEPEAAAAVPPEPQEVVPAPESVPEPEATAPSVPTPATIHVPSPAVLAGRLHGSATPKPSEHGRVDESGTVFVRTSTGEREVGSYPGASPAEALSYFTRKYDELVAAADLLLQRVTHTDLAAREGSEGLAKLREQTAEAHVVGDLDALDAKIAQITAAVEAKKSSEGAERSAAREAGKAQRERLVAEAEKIAGQPETKIQWKTSGTRMRELLDEWKSLQRTGPKLDRASETALWQRFSAARNSFDKARRVHFAQLEDTQAEARSAKEKLVKEAEALATSKDWAPTATAFKRLMDRWREAGRASRTDDDALWARFKTAQDSFFNAKDELVAAENEELKANLVVKEELLVEAEAILPITDGEAAQAALRVIADKWEQAGKVPRADMERVEKRIRRVEQEVRDHHEKRWASVNPEAAARAQSLVDQLELAVKELRKDLEKAQTSGDAKKVADAQSALDSREQWLAQARAGVQEFSG